MLLSETVSSACFFMQHARQLYKSLFNGETDDDDENDDKSS
jgi:hypothetical protein